MDQFAGLGTTVAFALAALIWIAYLVPVWLRRRSFLATERNAVRLQQTLRIMAESAETPAVVHVAADAREIARQQRLIAKEAKLQQAIARAEAVSRAKEIDDQIKAIERQVKQTLASTVTRRERLRRTKLACTVMLVLSVAMLVLGVTTSAALLGAAAGVVGMLAISGLIAVNRSSEAVRRVTAQVRAVTEEIVPLAAASNPVQAVADVDFGTRAWTPVRVPPQLAGRPQDGAGLVVPAASGDDVPDAYGPMELLRAAAAGVAQESGPLATVTPIMSESFDEILAGGADTQVIEPAQSRRVVKPAMPEVSSLDMLEDTGDVLDIGAALRRRRAS